MTAAAALDFTNHDSDKRQARCGRAAIMIACLPWGVLSIAEPRLRSGPPPIRGSPQRVRVRGGRAV